MTTIQDIVNNCDAIIKLITNLQFSNPIFFKGFNEQEKHNLCIYVTDTSHDKTTPEVTRRTKLAEALGNLLGCSVYISTKKTMDPIFLKLLNTSNSVEFTNKNDFIENLKNVFGKNWAFESLPNYDFWHKSTKLEAQTEQKVKTSEMPTNQQLSSNFKPY